MTRVGHHEPVNRSVARVQIRRLESRLSQWVRGTVRLVGVATLLCVPAWLGACERQRSAPANGDSTGPIERIATPAEPDPVERENEAPPPDDELTAEVPQTRAYANERYGFRLSVPADWDIAAEPRGILPLGPSEAVAFALPAVWSELEDTDIRNAVSVKAIVLLEACSAEDFVDMYALFESDGRVSMESVADFPRPAYVEVVKWRGLTYKRRLEFEMRSGIGYVLEFTATPGTFDQNYPRFRHVADHVEFFPPAAGEGDGAP